MVDTLAKYLGQPVIIEYMPGAGTTLASANVAKAVPDGYTIYMNASGIYGSDKVLYKKSARYEAKDFTPITRWTIAPMILAVSTASGDQNHERPDRASQSRTRKACLLLIWKWIATASGGYVF
ncbi:tripartite tricarboxylate transporter substrate-binding protein [Variovorax sp. EL159]|uniref:tripartite tricarboxylate transporter substrate-binding protein n=1 Tax=Variovorax sp. EL159 TaxID=1566270 RepID=UPI000A53B072